MLYHIKKLARQGSSGSLLPGLLSIISNQMIVLQDQGLVVTKIFLTMPCHVGSDAELLQQHADINVSRLSCLGVTAWQMFESRLVEHHMTEPIRAKLPAGLPWLMALCTG